jgi:hypothetical protein
MSVVVSEDGSGIASLQVSGDSFAISLAGEAELLSDYLYDMSVNDTTGDFMLEQRGTIASTAMAGSVSFVTLTPFTSNVYLAGGNPTAGVLHITSGVDSSQALVITQPDGIYDLIEVDTDGIGGYDHLMLITGVAPG